MPLIVLYWGCVFAVFYSYVLYPAILEFLARGKSFKHPVYSGEGELPEVIIFFSVYNGERVLKSKIESMLASDYPRD